MTKTYSSEAVNKIAYWGKWFEELIVKLLEPIEHVEVTDVNTAVNKILNNENNFFWAKDPDEPHGRYFSRAEIFKLFSIEEITKKWPQLIPKKEPIGD